MGIFAITPDLDEVVASGAGEALDYWCGRWLGNLSRTGLGLLRGDEGPWNDGRCPRYSIAADGMTIEDISVPLAIICEGLRYVDLE